MRIKPSRVPLAVSRPRRSRLKPQRNGLDLCPRVTGGPDLRLDHVNCPVATFEVSVSSPRPPTMSNGWEPFVVALKLYGGVIRGSGPLT